MMTNHYHLAWMSIYQRRILSTEKDEAKIKAPGDKPTETYLQSLNLFKSNICCLFPESLKKETAAELHRYQYFLMLS